MNLLSVSRRGRLIALLAALPLFLLLALLAASYAPDRDLESLKPRWAAPESGSRFIELDGIAVHVRDTAQAPLAPGPGAGRMPQQGAAAGSGLAPEATTKTQAPSPFKARDSSHLAQGRTGLAAAGNRAVPEVAESDLPIVLI
ncbi:MAG: hypothetical protein N2483_09255, partial [Burkholderiaceae bacterium]|nr:hypothetical protein [Burkholderiaceae bacterium]